LTETASVNIKNCKELKRDTEESGQQMRKDRKRRSGVDGKKLKELQV
jgi:hypothetical protein